MSGQLGNQLSISILSNLDYNHESRPPVQDPAVFGTSDIIIYHVTKATILAFGMHCLTKIHIQCTH
jgi:hypothetical protein